ncbi:ankyrin repeat protein [Pandoravirus inopinatum]|uniref:Ankyrin repeat protein n=1 Tax=Pandoravirus inopinatum TaxID=1605721 RepID=A0A0B5JCG9_9VIRU|nr:ankyrin repeat protein [Pandoravirus inopinatum]AJF97322.1 ankyrin repeat protein [Pandoravirus inopinatum]
MDCVHRGHKNRTAPIDILPQEIVGAILWMLGGRDLLSCLCASSRFHAWSEAECDRRRYSSLAADTAATCYGPAALDHLAHRRGVVFDSSHLLLAASHGRTANVDWLLDHTDAADRVAFVNGQLACPHAVIHAAAATAGSAPLVRALIERGFPLFGQVFVDASKAGHIDVMEAVYKAAPALCTTCGLGKAVRDGHTNAVAFLLDHFCTDDNRPRIFDAIDKVNDLATAALMHDHFCGTSGLPPVDSVTDARTAMTFAYARDGHGWVVCNAPNDAIVARLFGDARTSATVVTDAGRRQKRNPLAAVPLDVAREMANVLCGPHCEMLDVCSAWFAAGGDLGGARTIYSMGSKHGIRMTRPTSEAEDAFDEPMLFAIAALRPTTTTEQRARWAREAALIGSVEVIKALLNDDDVDTKCTSRLIGIIVDTASVYGQLDVLRYLGGRGGVDWTQTSLLQPATRGHLDVLVFLHERGARATTHEMDWAASNGHLKIVEFLHWNRTEGCTTSAMDGAAEDGHIEIVEFLYQNRTEGCTPRALWRAIDRGHADVVAFLLDHDRRPPTGHALMAAVDPQSGLDKALVDRVLGLCDGSALCDALCSAIVYRRHDIVDALLRVAGDRQPFDEHVFGAAVHWQSMHVLSEMATRTPQLCNRRAVESMSVQCAYMDHCPMAERARQQIVQMLSMTSSSV